MKGLDRRLKEPEVFFSGLMELVHEIYFDRVVKLLPLNCGFPRHQPFQGASTQCSFGLLNFEPQL